MFSFGAPRAFQLAKKGATAELKAFLEKNPTLKNSINKNKQSLLIIACTRKDSSMVEMLIGFEADLDLADADGNTPLLIASGLIDVQSVKMLLNAGADVNKSNNDKVSPLHWAAVHDASEIVMILLDNLADVDALDKHRRTPLIVAIRSGSVESASLIIQYHPDTFVRDELGNTVDDYAKQRNFLQLVIQINESGDVLKRKESRALLLNHLEANRQVSRPRRSSAGHRRPLLPDEQTINTSSLKSVNVTEDGGPLSCVGNLIFGAFGQEDAPAVEDKDKWGPISTDSPIRSPLKVRIRSEAEGSNSRGNESHPEQSMCFIM